MLYILDANVLIDANRDYYPIGRVPDFWEWLVEAGKSGFVKIPIEVYEEIKDGKVTVDALAAWAKDDEVSAAMLLLEEASPDIVARVINEGYASNLNENEIEQIGRDPFLLAYAIIAPGERCIVTTEVSKPSKSRANRHLPDVCDQFGIKHCNTHEFTKALDFKTKWQRR